MHMNGSQWNMVEQVAKHCKFAQGNPWVLSLQSQA